MQSGNAFINTLTESFLVIANRSRSQQRDKASLPEMVIRGERLPNAQLPHEAEAHAIGEGPVLIGVLPEQGCCEVETVRTDPFQAQTLAALDSVQKIRGGGVTVARQQQS